MKTNAENWKPVPAWERFYEVSDRGRVRSLDRVVPGKAGRPMRKRGKMLTPGHDKDGYARVVLVSAGERKEWRVHALVLRAFLGPRPIGMECCHNNGRKSDNRIANLRYDTPAGNYSDRRAHGASNDGPRNGRAKLTERDIRRIRDLRGSVSQITLAKEYGVVSSVVSAIQRREIWRSVE